MAVTLIRHTRVAVEPGWCYGRTDVPLASTFAEEFAAVHAKLGRRPGVVFSSPARRCRQLAETLGASEVRVDVRLQELDFGAWENRRWAEIPRAEVDAWALDFVEAPLPGGESFRALAARVEAFRRELAGPDAVIVTHGGVIRTWRCLAAGRPLQEAFGYELAYGEIVTLGA